MPIPLAHLIISDCGLLVGFKLCYPRPHIYMQRYNKCQVFYHNEKCCPSRASNDCQTTPCCINFKQSNRLHHTKFNVTHKASDPAGETFRHAYSMERERLDIFMLSRTEKLPPSQQSYTAHNFQTIHQPIYNLRIPSAPPRHYHPQSLSPPAPPWNKSYPADARDFCPDDNTAGRQNFRTNNYSPF